MPNLDNAVFTNEAFQNESDVTITGSIHFILLSCIGIGALQHYFS